MVRITANEKSLLFTFTNSNHYFQNGTVEVPKNSLALIVDDSDMASFKKSASNDLFISASYTELGMSKAELISWFEENGFSEGGSGGGLTPEEAQEMIDESVSGKADTSALTVFFDGVEYNSNNKTIDFYNGNVLKDSIDATDFIKDGMVDNVSISGGNLVITFNTDAGKEDIEIPLIDIFNPNNYYTKTVTDGLLDAKVDVTAYTAYTSSTETALNGKASQTDLETVSGDVATKLATSDFNTYTAATDTVISSKASQTDLNTVSGDVATKLSTSDFNTYSGGVDTALQGKADASDLANYVETSAFTAYTSATDTALNGKASQTDLETVSGNVDTISGDVETINLALADKADTTAVTEAISEAVSGKTDLSAFTAFTSSTETALNDKLAINDFNTYSGGVDTELSNKADASALADKVDLTAYTAYTSATDTVLQGKADVSDLADKVDLTAYTAYTAATETTINGKASQTDLNTVSGAVDTLSGQLADKADTTAMTTALADKLDVSTFETYSGDVDTALSGKASQSDLNTLSGDVIDIQTALQGKADTSDLANYVEVTAYTAYTAATDTALSGKASQTDLNTVSGDVATVSGSVANKQDILVSGTNIKTINNTSLLGSGNIDIQGGGGQTVTSVTQAEYDALVVKDPDTFYIISDATGSTITIDPSLDSGSTNAVANSAITIAIDAKADTTAMTQALSSKVDVSAYTAYTAATDTVLSGKASQTDLNTVSAATASNTTALGGYSLWKGTQAQYDAIVTKDEDTIYFIVNNS